MATLKSLADQAMQPLAPRTLIGRSSSCALCIDGIHASGEHATITWTGDRWVIRDLGSRNGTFVDGSKLEPGIGMDLASGSRIAFGDPELVWELADDGAPSVLAVNLRTRDARPATDGLLVLPTSEAPELSIYQAVQGSWVEESDEGGLRTIADQKIVKVAGEDWRIHLPFVAEGTPLIERGMTIEGISLRFAVTRDEETVQITILDRGIETNIEPREHGYVLLTLARARAEDAHRPPGEKGWRSRKQLQKMLRMDSNALNVAIHRARQQLLSAGVEGAAGIVEVRRGERRLGTERFHITSA